MNIIGFDPSLSHSVGYHAHGLAEGQPLARAFAIKSSPKEFPHGVARLESLRGRLRAELVRAAEACGGPGLFVVEGYSYGSRNAREALGEWGGQVRLTAYELGWQILDVQPSALKKYVADKGNAPKEMMILGVFKRWKHTASDNNDADGYALMRLGVEFEAWRAGEAVPKRVVDIFKKLSVLQPAQTAAA